MSGVTKKRSEVIEATKRKAKLRESGSSMMKDWLFAVCNLVM